MRTVVVTGGCGFIGSHFVRLLLERGYGRVVNLDKLTYAGNRESLTDVEDHEAYRFVQGDIVDLALLDRLFQEEHPWAVVNFAAESHVDRSILDPSPFLRTNTVGVQCLLEACRRSGVQRIVQVSTDEVYGDMEGKEPSTETSPLAPSSPYAASKAAADLLCLAYLRTYGTPVLIARSSNNYGPWQFPEKLIPLTIRNTLLSEPLPVYGDGEQKRDWMHVQDNVAALFAILDRGKVGSIYNVATEIEHSNLDVVQEICRIVAKETERDAEELRGRIRLVPDRPGHDRRYAMRAEKIRSELGWSPVIFLREGQAQTVRWYIENQQWVHQVTSGEYQGYYDSVYRRAWRAPDA